ncbi:2,4-dienoyl-CoA reductase-like NADH-dependent reductase (Old Yellow Enzyme family) [Gemmobacter caeni]|jgi:2,4-dienoyl-CoA reductase-like NADH-dependent reductase (Old Yellow Enzyme family)|uniref:2,4-dienoyl-CoA reductase-like NADH-dependent reductase (Old Yellow Enzyme family) n=2 Tax=Gemmobacter TaxID=204456 RepID=A0A2T6AS27_9RHOB|nr:MULTISPECIES: NADH:flavin oxidoreductase [Gemmobacter]OJY25455.1 MAG: 12-oxophytodienoate reductase [Rhodobacterales bacterium 65-51]PTX46625.1 2,4-dienoyl-CoA reductase-like NADH-dependent reductase (Old Yellow Enzyme family) [Gemmobacter caeni]TWI95474.1 2,4-dienoyl-CoA reductase-like NADH-dependent reductase (Old Yellow Enzyme family) [Gemmobacter caeni]GHC23312.1 12-oxophytodienoate reductase [Gemmobacter nanjingensis]
MTATEPLFRPFRLKGLELRNRIVMAPMTRDMAPEGVPGGANAEYYRRRAAGGVGLILSEGTVIDRPASRNLPNIPFFHGDKALQGWRGVAEAVHGAGAKIGPQIWHTGSTKGGAWKPEAEVESPSGLLAPDKPRGRAMTEEDIADTIAAFARAAADAKRIGMDLVEVHGAHGYLIDQFFWQGTNLRDDRWGGATLPERSRFAVEVLKAVRAAVGPDFPVLLRVSQWKQQDYGVKLAASPQEMEAWLGPLVEAGADVLHCSQRRFWDAEFPEIDGDTGLNFAGWAKKLTGAPTISVGSVGLGGAEFLAAFRGEGAGAAPLGQLMDRMARDEFDLIAVGRALISDPDWVRHVEAGDTAALRGFDARDLAELV